MGGPSLPLPSPLPLRAFLQQVLPTPVISDIPARNSWTHTSRSAAAHFLTLLLGGEAVPRFCCSVVEALWQSGGAGGSGAHDHSSQFTGLLVPGWEEGTGVHPGPRTHILPRGSLMVGWVMITSSVTPRKV